MALNNKIISIFTCLFLSYASWSMAESEPEAKSQWQDSVYKNIKDKSPIAATIWKDVLAHGTITGKHLGKDKRRVFTLIQASVEEELVAALNAKSIKSAVIIIHALQPSTPLRIGFKNDGLNLKQLNISPKSQTILLQRSKILKNYLEAGGTLVSVYQHDPKSKNNQGFKQYLTQVEKYELLLDNPVKSMPQKYWGATYLLRQLDDSILAFSISSSQPGLSQEATDLEWQIWLGPLLETKISKRVVQVESFLRSENIDVYNLLGFKSGD